MNHEEIVRVKYPLAQVIMNEQLGGYHRYEIWFDGRYLGGGPTPEIAWQNAWVHHFYKRE